ncbi:YraN family protein, partial [Streptomyces ipomoeae]
MGDEVIHNRPAVHQDPIAGRVALSVGAGGGADMSNARGVNARGALGRYGEELAARRLTEAGMTVLERNWRCGRTGEIDIVARDGDALVVCEVKTRRAGAFEHPMAAVTPTKADRLRGLAERWLQEHGRGPTGRRP